MAEVPLTFVFRGDIVTQLVLVEDTDTMDGVCEKVAYHIVARRVPDQETPMRVHFKGETLAAEQTVAQAGLKPMDYIEVSFS